MLCVYTRASKQTQVGRPSRGLLRDCEIFANLRLTSLTVIILRLLPGVVEAGLALATGPPLPGRRGIEPRAVGRLRVEEAAAHVARHAGHGRRGACGGGPPGCCSSCCSCCSSCCCPLPGCWAGRLAAGPPLPVAACALVAAARRLLGVVADPHLPAPTTRPAALAPAAPPALALVSSS